MDTSTKWPHSVFIGTVKILFYQKQVRCWIVCQTPGTIVSAHIALVWQQNIDQSQINSELNQTPEK
jgi:hypothetical protein